MSTEEFSKSFFSHMDAHWENVIRTPMTYFLIKNYSENPNRGELPISYWSPKSYLINFSVINEYKRHLMINISSKCEIRNRKKTF